MVFIAQIRVVMCVISPLRVNMSQNSVKLQGKRSNEDKAMKTEARSKNLLKICFFLIKFYFKSFLVTMIYKNNNTIQIIQYNIEIFNNYNITLQK